MNDATHAPGFIDEYVNLASPQLGSRAVLASDEFFAPKERMLADAPALFIPDKYDVNGKWMDGWETRRRRTIGNDWCLVRLGLPGIVKGVDIDTSHFTGNYPPAASLEGVLSATQPKSGASWRVLVSRAALGPNAHHYLPVADGEAVNWLRLQIYPDGGIARLRVYGIPVHQWSAADRGIEIELSALRHGGRIVAFNDAHYGNVSSLLGEGRGKSMGDGWETRRRREPGNDWVIVALAAPGTIVRVEIDTAHFKGNYPDRCSLQGALVEGGAKQSIIAQSMFWPELMGMRQLKADSIHAFSGVDIAKLGSVSHVKLNIFPDGGVSRLRLFGMLA